jgi:hypothetical protein
MDVFSHFEKMVNIHALKQQPASTRKVDNQLLVSEDMKKKWDEATLGKETAAALIAVIEILVHDDNQVITCTMGDLVQLVGQYARLSLAGSCSAQVKSIVRFLQDFDPKRTDVVILERDKENLVHMKRKLEFLNQVEKDAQKGVSN